MNRIKTAHQFRNGLVTQRLSLRQWQPKDARPFAKLNADARVREHFPSRLSPAESDAAMRTYQRHIEKNGWGLWAVELMNTGHFIGFIGLQSVAEEMPCAPAVEIGWRLAVPFWGKGYASEGAREVVRFAFEKLQLNRIVSLTTTTNIKSQKVMQRLGLIDTKQNFNHPKIPPEHRLAEHVLYQLTSEDWLSGQS